MFLLYGLYLSIPILLWMLSARITHLNRGGVIAKQLVTFLIALSVLLFATLLQWVPAAISLVVFAGQLWSVALVATFFAAAFFIYSLNTKHEPPLPLKLTTYILLLPLVLLIPTTLNVVGFDPAACRSVIGGWVLGYSYFLSVTSLLFIVYTTWKGIQNLPNFSLSGSVVKMAAVTIIPSLLFLLLAVVYFKIPALVFFAENLLLLSVLFVSCREKRVNLGLSLTSLVILLVTFLVGISVTVGFQMSSESTSLLLTFLIVILVLSLFRANQINRQQADKIQYLSDRLATADHRLAALDRLESRFIDLTSRQLRNPVAVIRGYTSMLLEGSFGSVSKKAVGAIEKISEAAKVMAYSIEDYLSVSKIEAGEIKFNFTDFNLRDEVENVCDELRPEALRKGVVLLFRSDLKSNGIVNADLGKTIQIIQKLLINAITYTEKGTIRVLVRDDVVRKKIAVEVEDTGIGIDKDTMDQLFMKFTRSQVAQVINPNGSGLGLYVAKKLAEAMHGDITAYSEGEGKGARFTFELPLAL